MICSIYLLEGDCYSVDFIIIIMISVKELGHLLTRSGLTYLEVSSEVCVYVSYIYFGRNRHYFPYTALKDWFL